MKKTTLALSFILVLLIAAIMTQFVDLAETDSLGQFNIGPVINSVSPIFATRLQTITIRGSGFEETQPQLLDLGDGSVDTVGGGITPVIRIYDQSGLNSWQAGVQDNPNSGADSIGIILVSWSDKEIVLGGFGTELNVNGQGSWNIKPGDPLIVNVQTTNGQAAYTTTVVSNQSDQNPTPTSTPTLTVSCKSSTTFSNFRVEISGSLTYNETGLQGFPILLSYSVDGGNSWNQLTLVSTDNSGDFLAVWLPSVTGNYLLKAEWTGDANYSETSTVISFAVSPSGEQNFFSVASNSTISALAFNSTSGELDFTVSGPPETMGYCNVYIPKSLISDASNLKVFLDGNPISYNAESSGDSWFVSFIYHHSTHEVVMEMNAVPSTMINGNQFEQWISYGVIIVLIAIIAVLLTSKKMKKL